MSFDAVRSFSLELHPDKSSEKNMIRVRASGVPGLCLVYRVVTLDWERPWDLRYFRARRVV